MAKSDRLFGSHQNADAQAILLNEFQLLDRSRQPIAKASLARAAMRKLIPLFKSFFRLPHIEDLPSKSYLIPNVFLKPFACSSNLEKNPSLTTWL